MVINVYACADHSGANTNYTIVGDQRGVGNGFLEVRHQRLYFGLR
jgi:hypothetical protein